MKPVYIDIHIHTSENPNELNLLYNKEKLLEGINKIADQNPVLISLTDHNTINKKVYLELLESQINLILGAELHIKKYEDAPPYHCHILFDIEVNGENIDDINSILDNLYPDKIVKDSDKKVPNIETISNAFDEYNYILLPHGGQSHRTFDKATAKDHKFDRSMEKSIYYNHFDGFTARGNKGLEETRKYFERLGINEYINLITCTDNYNPDVYPSAKAKDAGEFIPTWMLSEPTFDGLRLALSESSRLHYGDKAPEKWISTVNSVKLSTEKAEIDVDLLPGLNVVIGGSSSGKTLFVDSLYYGIKKEFDSSKYIDFGIEDIYIDNPGGEIPHYINQNFIVSILQNSKREIGEIDIIKDVFPEDKTTVEKIRMVLANLKKLVNKMVDSVKIIEECEEHLSHLSNLSHLILKDKMNKNIFSLLITSSSDRKFLKISEIEYEEFKETLTKMNSFFIQHPILENMENEINAFIKKLDIAYNISSFDEDIYDSIIKLKAQEDKKLNKDNKENSQKTSQREQMISEVRKYLTALNDFYETKKELSNLDVSFKTKELEVRGHKLSVENSFKITKETLIDAFNSYIKARYRISDIKDLKPEILFKKCFSEKPKVSSYDDFAKKIYNEINSTNTKKYKIITSNGKDFDKLSPGWKSAIILDLVLGYENDIAPLIIDQPEDNLATDYINRNLIDLIKTIKSKKQIILVSHNATIPMLGDAQNIILCENKDGKIQIKSAPLESSINNKKVLDYIAEITDGGKKSIKKRIKKYNLKAFNKEIVK